jgi:hypothetical protein
MTTTCDTTSDSAAYPGDRIVSLNVGGTLMTTYRSTLMAAPSDSVLRRMFACDEKGDDSTNAWRPPVLADGSYFLNFDPAHFAIVLNVMRHGTRSLAFLPPEARAGAALVADYLGLVDVAHHCNSIVLTPLDQKRYAAIIGAGSMWKDGFELCDIGRCHRIEFGTQWSMGRLRAHAVEACLVPDEHAGVYWLRSRKNRTLRPDGLIDPGSVVPAHCVRTRRLKRADAALLVLDMRTVVSVPGHDGGTDATAAPLTVMSTDSKVLLFVRRYDRKGEDLGACVPALVDSGRTLASLAPDLWTLVKPPTADIRCVVFYEEVHPDMVMPLDMDRTLASQEVEQGDILWIEFVADGGSQGERIKSGDVPFVRLPSHYERKA